MKAKAVIILLGTVLAVSGAVFKGSQNANANIPETSAIEANQTSISPKFKNLDIIAQYGSPWGQVVSSTTYRNPDTGQELCFYSSSRWAPCPGQGDVTIVPSNAKCRGGNSTEDLMNQCPVALCTLNQASAGFTQPGVSAPPTLPCTGLP
jgi:hypothetical protein